MVVAAAAVVVMVAAAAVAEAVQGEVAATVVTGIETEDMIADIPLVLPAQEEVEVDTMTADLVLIAWKERGDRHQEGKEILSTDKKLHLKTGCPNVYW